MPITFKGCCGTVDNIRTTNDGKRCGSYHRGNSCEISSSFRHFQATKAHGLFGASDILGNLQTRNEISTITEIKMTLTTAVDSLLSLFQVEGQFIENTIIIVIGGMPTIIFLFCTLALCVAICNMGVFFKDLVKSCTGREKRKTWTHAENVKVMECYYKSKLSKDRGYVQRMLDLWMDEGMVVLSKERLAGQSRSILKRKLLSEDELKEIRDRVGFQEEEERQGRQGRCLIC